MYLIVCPWSYLFKKHTSKSFQVQDVPCFLSGQLQAHRWPTSGTWCAWSWPLNYCIVRGLAIQHNYLSGIISTLSYPIKFIPNMRSIPIIWKKWCRKNRQKWPTSGQSTVFKVVVLPSSFLFRMIELKCLSTVLFISWKYLKPFPRYCQLKVRQSQNRSES